MHVNLRRYPKLGAPRQTVERSVENELVPGLKEQPGFRGYWAFITDDGGTASISAFDTEEAAEWSADKARQWITRHPDFFPERGEEFSGGCVAHDAPHGREQQTGAGREALYVLVRELENVPEADRLRWIAQRKTRPLIAQAEGFRGLFVVGSDKRHRRAAVVTLFDNWRNALKSHEQAARVLSVDLPEIRVARVVHGPTVIVAGGDSLRPTGMRG